MTRFADSESTRPYPHRSSSWMWPDNADGTELYNMVMSWPWRVPAGGLGTNGLFRSVAAGLDLPWPTLERQDSPRGQGHWCRATIELNSTYRAELRPGEPQVHVCTDPLPLAAVLMVCWRALAALGRLPPRELDTLIVGGLTSGRLLPGALGIRWEAVEEAFPGRECPPEVLARASVCLVLAAQGSG